MDLVVQKVVALGVPGLILVFVVASTGLAGGAAIVSALAVLGGPLGMMGGLAVLSLLTLISDALARYGLDAIAKAVLKGLREAGTSTSEIRRKVNSAPITGGMKRRILEYV